MRKLQSGVMGSAADLKFSKDAEIAAFKLGELIAENQCILIYGAEKDVDSLSTVACKGAKNKGGLTVGITYGKHKNIFYKDTDVTIPTGIDRGGGREFVLSLSCDVLIAISGGSGTLNEIAVAYQADIPIIALTGYGGWADNLEGTFLDNRNRRKIIAAKTPDKAIKLAIEQAKKYADKYA